MMTGEQGQAILVLANRAEDAIKSIGDQLVQALDEIRALRILVSISNDADSKTVDFMTEHAAKVSRETARETVSNTAAMPIP
jgi:hypothetical protein